MRHAWLCHPVTMVAAVVLLLNDHLLKQAHPGFVTGKLSDVAGLVVAPPLAALLLARRADLAVMLATGALFTLVKTTETGAQAASHLWTLAAGPSRVLADPTDLVALPALALAWWVRRRTLTPAPRPRPAAGGGPVATERWGPGAGRWRAVAGVALAVVAVTASGVYYPPPPVLAVRVEGQRVVVVAGYLAPDGPVQGLVSTDGGRTWSEETVAAPDGTGPVGAPSAACVPYQARRCYRVVPGRVAVEQSDDGGTTWHASWELSQGRIDVLARTHPTTDMTAARSRGLAVQPRPGGHVVVVASDAAGLTVRDVSGDWRHVGWPEFAAPWSADPVEGEREVAYVFALAVLLGALGSGMRRLHPPYMAFALLACGGLYYTTLRGFADHHLGEVRPVALALGAAATLLGVVVCLSLAAAGRARGRALLVGLAGAPLAFAAVYAPFHGWARGTPDSYGIAVAMAACLAVTVPAAVVALVRRQAAAPGPEDYLAGSSTSRPT